MKKFMQLLLATFGVFALLAGCTTVDVDEDTTDDAVDTDEVVDEVTTDDVVADDEEVVEETE